MRVPPRECSSQRRALSVATHWRHSPSASRPVPPVVSLKFMSARCASSAFGGGGGIIGSKPRRFFVLLLKDYKSAGRRLGVRLHALRALRLATALDFWSGRVLATGTSQLRAGSERAPPLIQLLLCAVSSGRPPCSSTKRNEASVAARRAGYQKTSTCVISGPRASKYFFSVSRKPRPEIQTKTKIQTPTLRTSQSN